jgi:hypothetical protein
MDFRFAFKFNKLYLKIIRIRSISNFKYTFIILSDHTLLGFFVLFFLGAAALGALNPRTATPMRIIKKTAIIIYFFLLLFGF